VIANNAPPQGGVGGITGLLGDEPPASRSENGGDGEGIALAVLAFAGTLVVLGTLGATALVRARSRGRQN
jgi:hypothetical protein